MLTKVGLAHVRIIYFFSSSPWLACLHVGLSDCMPDNGINYLKNGRVLQYFSAPFFLCYRRKGACCILL